MWETASCLKFRRSSRCVYIAPTPSSPPTVFLPHLFSPLPHTRAPKMMRQQLSKGVRQSQRLSGLNVARSFTSSHYRPAEVEITVGGSSSAVAM